MAVCHLPPASMSQKTGNAVSGTVNKKKTRENVGPRDYIGTL